MYSHLHNATLSAATAFLSVRDDRLLLSRSVRVANDGRHFSRRLSIHGFCIGGCLFVGNGSVVFGHFKSLVEFLR